MRNGRLSVTLAKAAAMFSAILLVTPMVSVAQQETILHNFSSNSKDGSLPQGNLIFDAAGNLYGTAYAGGGYGVGTVFELSPLAAGGWTEKVLHTFSDNGKDGFNPYGSLALDGAGNLYGTAEAGGVYNDGVVFELTPNASGVWAEKVLHNFNNNGTDGYNPIAGVILDHAGNLYSTTLQGGTYNFGTVFELSPLAGGGWAEKVLHSFNQNGVDGTYPRSGLIFDASENLYGTACCGGASGGGIVFEMKHTVGGGWAEKIFHNFSYNGTDGWYVYGGVAFDASGSLYGNTVYGGLYNYGTSFQLTPGAGGAWIEKILHNFNADGTDGHTPFDGLAVDPAGNLYGTNLGGGSLGGGTVFKLTLSGGTWTETILHNFVNNGTDGYEPYAGLILDASGNLYGATFLGGSHTGIYSGGTIFKIKP